MAPHKHAAERPRVRAAVYGTGAVTAQYSRAVRSSRMKLALQLTMTRGTVAEPYSRLEGRRRSGGLPSWAAAPPLNLRDDTIPQRQTEHRHRSSGWFLRG